MTFFLFSLYILFNSKSVYRYVGDGKGTNQFFTIFHVRLCFWYSKTCIALFQSRHTYIDCVDPADPDIPMRSSQTCHHPFNPSHPTAVFGYFSHFIFINVRSVCRIVCSATHLFEYLYRNLASEVKHRKVNSLRVPVSPSQSRGVSTSVSRPAHQQGQLPIRRGISLSHLHCICIKLKLNYFEAEDGKTNDLKAWILVSDWQGLKPESLPRLKIEFRALHRQEDTWTWTDSSPQRTVTWSLPTSWTKLQLSNHCQRDWD